MVAIGELHQQPRSCPSLAACESWTPFPHATRKIRQQRTAVTTDTYLAVSFIIQYPQTNARERVVLSNPSIHLSLSLDLGVVDLALELLVFRDLPNRLHKVLLRQINGKVGVQGVGRNKPFA